MKASINAVALMCPAERLEMAWELYAPLGLRKDGRRVRAGLIDKKLFLKLVNAS